MEQKKTSEETNYLRLAAAFLFLQAAGGLYCGKRKGTVHAKTVEAAAASEMAQDEMMAAHGCYEGEREW